MSVILNGVVLPYVLAAAAVGALLLPFWMVVVERRLFRVRRVVLDADGAGLPELRILHITDTHFHGRDGAILRFLRRLSAREQFDLVFLTGDLIDRPPGVRSAIVAASLFEPRLGTFAVLGGHDYVRPGTVRTYRHLLHRWPPDTTMARNPAEELKRGLADGGVRVLQDSHALVDAAGGNDGPLAIVGLRDAFQFVPDPHAAWDGLPAGVPAIVIAHCPDVIADVAARRARLAFFGHTHGGQVRFPFVGALVTRSTIPGRLAAGTFRHAGTIFTLNNGLGTSPATPYRLLCRPEVTVLELTRSAAPGELTRIEDARLDRE